MFVQLSLDFELLPAVLRLASTTTKHLLLLDIWNWTLNHRDRWTLTRGFGLLLFPVLPGLPLLQPLGPLIVLVLTGLLSPLFPKLLPFALTCVVPCKVPLRTLLIVCRGLGRLVCGRKQLLRVRFQNLVQLLRLLCLLRCGSCSWYQHSCLGFILT